MLPSLRTVSSPAAPPPRVTASSLYRSVPLPGLSASTFIASNLLGRPRSVGDLRRVDGAQGVRGAPLGLERGDLIRRKGRSFHDSRTGPGRGAHRLPHFSRAGSS